MNQEESAHLSLSDSTGMSEFMRASAQSNLSLFDQKAGAILAFDVAMALYVLQNLICPDNKAECFTSLALAGDLTACLAGLVLISACIASLRVLRPKSNTEWKDTVFWGASIFRLSLDDFFRQMAAASPHQTAENKMRHVYVLAQICRAKAARLKLAGWLTAFAFFLVVGTKIVRVMIAAQPSRLDGVIQWLHQHVGHVIAVVGG